MKNLEETKFINAGHVKEFIDELEDEPEKYEKELRFLFEKYNSFTNFKAYKMNLTSYIESLMKDKELQNELLKIVDTGLVEEMKEFARIENDRKATREGEDDKILPLPMGETSS